MARRLAETTWGCSTRRRKISLSILAVGLGISFSGCNRPAAPAAAAAPHEQSKTLVKAAPAVPAPELIEVWVAARDLPVGTLITRGELNALAVKKKLPKNAMPLVYVADSEKLIDRRLTRLAYKDAPFDEFLFSPQTTLNLPEGLDLVSLSLPGISAAIDHLVLRPGTKADVHATLNHPHGGTARFPLLVDVLVLAADANLTNPPTHSVSFAVTQEQALLLALAKQRECKLEILPQSPSKQDVANYNIKRVLALLQDDQKLAMLFKTAADRLPTSPIPELIAAPRELIEVWVAVSDIPPRAVITPQLVDAKLKKINVPKDRAEGAISDLTNLLEEEWTLGLGLRQGQWLTTSLVGPPQPVAKAEPEPLEVAPMPRVVKPKKYKDVTITTPSGVVIHRFEEVAPGRFKLIRVFRATD
jgi:pilus assembly protein CpaB